MPRVIPVPYLLGIFGALCCANIFIYHVLFTAAPVDLVVQRAGKGTVALLHTRSGWVLLNTGSDGSILRVLGTTLAPWTRTLSVLLLTDTASVHEGGAPELLQRYRINTFLRLGTFDTSSRGVAIDQSMRAEGVHEISHVAYGSNLRVNNITLTLSGPNSVAIHNQNKTLVVSSTTSVGTYRF